MSRKRAGGERRLIAGYLTVEVPIALHRSESRSTDKSGGGVSGVDGVDSECRFIRGAVGVTSWEDDTFVLY